VLAISIGFILVNIGVGIFLTIRKISKTSYITYTNTEFKLSFSYPENFKETPLTETQNKENFLFRAVSTKPNSLLSLRYEKGLGVLKVTGGTILDALITNVNRRYPERFPEFKKTKFEEKAIGNEKSAVFEFTYLGTDKKTRMKQRLNIIVKDNNAYYLSFQSPEIEFEKYIQELDKIDASFSFL